jgi:hypothetical protein
MPFKSEAQRRYFHWAKREGKISPKTVREWEEHTPEGKKLPERIHPKKKYHKKIAQAFFDELAKLAQPAEHMPGVPEAMQQILTRQAAQAHAHAGSPLGGQTRKKLKIKFPTSARGAQRLSGKLGKFISSRRVM